MNTKCDKKYVFYTYLLFKHKIKTIKINDNTLCYGNIMKYSISLEI